MPETARTSTLPHLCGRAASLAISPDCAWLGQLHFITLQRRMQGHLTTVASVLRAISGKICDQEVSEYLI